MIKFFETSKEKQQLLDFCDHNHFSQYLFLGDTPSLSMIERWPCYGFYDADKLVGIGFLWIKTPSKPIDFLNIAFLPVVRGKKALSYCKKWLKRYRIPQRRLCSLVRKDHKHIKRFNELVGLVTIGESHDFWLMEYK